MSHRTVDVFRIILTFVVILSATPPRLCAQSQSVSAVDGSFTGSTGRSILYRYWIKDNWDTSQPRGLLIFFHGNNKATAEDIRSWGFVSLDDAFDLGLAVANVASPNSRGEGPADLFGYDLDSYGTRVWARADQRLIHELLQSDFNSTLAIDHHRIVFMGGSQGTCFLAEFLERYIGVYAGGFHAWCGCFWTAPSNPPRRRSPTWRPFFQWTPLASSFVKSRFRVFVEATTGDFLHADGVAMEKYYSELLGLDTRSDLEAPGGHCSTGTTPRADIWKWLSSVSVPPLPGDENDVDGDGIANAVDSDDDNDGALDFIDALPLEPRDHLDTDLDGIGNFADDDADGDGVANAQDPFPLDPREWIDTDEDGIGNVLDADDDNDGTPDASDPRPLHGTRNDQLTFRMVETGVSYGSDRYPTTLHPAAVVHSGKPASVVYPASQGDRQSYQYIVLGNSIHPRFEIMIDRFYRDETCEETLLPVFCDPMENYDYFEHYIDKIYIDRNRNRNLADDGPPLLLARNNRDRFSIPGVITVLEVPYASGGLFPYGIILWTREDALSGGARYKGASTWMGHAETPSGRRVLVGVIDANLDGVFHSGEPPDDFDGPIRNLRDVACIDLDRNGVLDECVETDDYTGERVNPVYPGQAFELDGARHTISVAPSGHRVTLFSEQAFPRTLAVISGDGQRGAPGSVLADSLGVQIRDQSGDPLPGISVTFTIAAGDGTLSATTATTDENGRASVALTLGSQQGTNTIVVTAANLKPVTFTASGYDRADFDGDGDVDFSDLLQFSGAFGSSLGDADYDAKYDLDGDGIVGFKDLLIFADAFG